MCLVNRDEVQIGAVAITYAAQALRSVIGLGAGVGFAKDLHALFSGSATYLPVAGLEGNAPPRV